MTIIVPYIGGAFPGSGGSVGTATSGQVLGYNGTNWVNTNKTLVVMRDWSVS